MGRDSLVAGHLHSLLQSSNQQPPHLLLLMGPFLDEEHALIRSGSLEEHFEAVFEREVGLLNVLWGHHNAKIATYLRCYHMQQTSLELVQQQTNCQRCCEYCCVAVCCPFNMSDAFLLGHAPAA